MTSAVAFLRDVYAHLKPRRCDLCGQRVPAICQDIHDAVDHMGDS